MECEPTGEVMGANEQQDRPPFVIRVHHLNNFRTILTTGVSVSDYVSTFVGDFEKKRASRHISRDGQSYINDVLGSTQGQVDTFRRHLTEFLEEFLQLVDDYPVEIVKDQKDKLCQGCAIGEHCSKRTTLIRELILGESSRDKIYIRAFRNGAKQLNLEDDLTVVDKTTTYSNAKLGKVKSILTTAQIVKEVILNSRAFNSLR